MLDLGPGGGSGQLRHDGFLEGFGIEDGDPQIVGAVDTEGNEEKGEAGMRQLLEQDPGINIVYTVNEPAAFGASAALDAAGRSDDDVILVSVDGGCEGIKRGIRTGEIDATSQQYPENMASKGVEAVADAARGGKKPVRLPRHGRRAHHRRSGGRRGIQGRGVRREELLGGLGTPRRRRHRLSRREAARACGGRLKRTKAQSGAPTLAVLADDDQRPERDGR